MTVTLANRLVQKRVMEALKDHRRWVVLEYTHLRRDDGLWVKYTPNTSKIEVGTVDHCVPQFWYNDIYPSDPFYEAIETCRDEIFDDVPNLPIIRLLGIVLP